MQLLTLKYDLPYLAGHTMGAQFAKTKGWLDPAQHSDHIDMFDSTPATEKEISMYTAPLRAIGNEDNIKDQMGKRD